MGGAKLNNLAVYIMYMHVHVNYAWPYMVSKFMAPPLQAVGILTVTHGLTHPLVEEGKGILRDLFTELSDREQSTA